MKLLNISFFCVLGVVVLAGQALGLDLYEITTNKTMVFDVQQSVSGEGFANTYQRMEIGVHRLNDLGTLEVKGRSHGSGSLSSETILKACRYYKNESFLSSNPVKVNKQSLEVNRSSEMVYSPVQLNLPGSFQVGPIESLWEDYSSAQHRGLGTAMGAQFDQATEINSQTETSLNWESTSGDDYFERYGTVKGISRMNVDSEFVGRGQIRSSITEKDREDKALVDEYYLGSFHIVKNMEVEVNAKKKTEAYEWLPCCSGGYEGLVKKYPNFLGIFDCTCLETSRAGMYGPAVGDEPFRV